MKKKTLLVLITLLLAVSVQAQQRDRLGELDVVCRNEWVTHISVAPDGTLWMATECGEIYRADDIHSPWRILKKGSLGGDQGETFENIVAFDRNTAVIVGNMWRGYFKRTTTGGQSWDEIKYDSKRGPEWFHPVWRGQGGTMWTGSQNGYLAFSTDSGRTFSVLYNTAFNDKTNIQDIYMLSADSGWIAIREGGLYSTSDNWRTCHRLASPYCKGVKRVRPWKSHLIVTQGGKSYYTAIGGNGRWQSTPLALRDFEVDTATGKLWALDENREIIMMDDIDRWKPMGASALFIIGMHNGYLYCRVNEGVMRVDANGVVDQCPFLTAEKSLTKPEKIFKHGDFQWGFDEKSVYLRDRKGWYRLARPLDIAGATPDPDRKDRVIILNYAGENFSVDTAGRVEPYIYPQPLADFVKPGLKSLEIMTFSTLGYNVYKETIGFRRDGDRLVEKTHTETRESYDPHLRNGPTKKTTPMAVDGDSDIRQLSASSMEKALLTLGERYHQYPIPQDFGLADTTLDLHQVYATGSIRSSNQYGYNVTFVNQAGDTLAAWGQASAHVDLGGSTHYPWLLPMIVRWHEAEFFTYQPVLWQALREAMPDSMLLREYLDNSTLHPRYTLQSGDLIFLNNNRSDMEKAITASTGEYTHVALVERDSSDDVWVIEASPKNGVQRISYEQFERNHLLGFFGGNMDIFRLTASFDTAAVITRAKKLVGKPYDNAFLPDNDAYYCSELIQVAFGGSFPSKPMNWRDSDGNLPEYWIKHFEELGVPVPEGVLGTNPTDMSRSPLMKMLK
ncbi:MAG: hypothetical protein J6T87_03995 [Bacteroidales bacterium]|nr:hypothetical protein [Bacteroidales bacterium]